MNLLLDPSNDSSKQRLYTALKSLAPGRYRVTIESADIRPLNKNARFHAVCGEIAKRVTWDGERLDLEDWKRLLVAAWMKATQRQVKLVRALDGDGFTPIYQRTSLLSKREINDLIEYAEAFAVDHDVPLWFPGKDEWMESERKSA